MNKNKKPEICYFLVSFPFSISHDGGFCESLYEDGRVWSPMEEGKQSSMSALWFWHQRQTCSCTVQAWKCFPTWWRDGRWSRRCQAQTLPTRKTRLCARKARLRCFHDLIIDLPAWLVILFIINFISRGKNKYKHSFKQYKTTLIPISPRRIAQKKKILSKGLSRLNEINKTHTNLQ